MGDTKLCLLLLLSTSALAYAQDDDLPTCLLAKRYKTLHRYEYRYEAESLNAIDGTSPMKNGPKATCTVEIEVPQMCSFIVRTTGCSLSQVVDMDAAGNPVFAPAPTSDDFAAEMERYPLKFVVEGKYDVKLYPEDGESTTILNVKRGIISALAVPLVEEDMNKKMPTIHGKCRTYSTVNSREDIATDVTLDRDLSRCDQFVPMRDHTSPLALVSRMHYPLAQMIRSSQTCNYKFDNAKKHMTSGSCIEKHILVPFSYNGEYGVTNIGKQELTLVQVSPHNDRVFDHSGIMKGLHMEAVEDKSAIQDKDAALVLLRELATLPETMGEKRAHLFRRLVTMVRGMRAETLKPAVPEALAVSRVLTYQVLAQCGTPECSSAIMDIFRTFDRSALEVDAGVFAMGLVSNPSPLLINDMLEMAKFKRSKSIMYALSNVVKRFYKAEEKMIPEIFAVAEFMAAQLGDCTGDMENTFMTLRVIGNMAPAMMSAGPAVRSAVIQCVNQPAASQEVQQAAVQVFRLASVPHEGREVLMRVLMDSSSPMQKRIAAYLVLMKDPKPTELAQLATFLAQEQNQQVKSFVESHIANILSLKSPETEELRQMIRDVLQGNEVGPIMDATKFSRNYKMGSLEGNVIFEENSYLPKEAMLEMTLRAFGYDIDMMEIGMEGKGFEPTVDALFGTNGFFPDTVMKTMYFVSDNMPVVISGTLEKIIPALRRHRVKTPSSNNLMRDLRRNLNKLVQELKNAESPEATVYLRLLGNELGYLKTKEMEDMVYSATLMFDSMAKMFPTDLLVAMMSRTDNTIFAHYIFMDNEFFLPTVTGLPLRVALSGTFTPGIKGGLKFARDMSEVAFMPSAGVEFVTQIGTHLPEFVNSGLEMHTNMFHESGLTAKVSMGPDSVKLTIPAPTSPTKLIKITNNLVAVTGSEMVSIPSMVMDKVDVSECTPVFAGMKYCSALQYADAFTQEFAPFFPFTGDSKFAVEMHPTGEVSEYTATLAYELLREGEEGRQKVDSVKFVLRAEGTEPSEARAIMKYNRRRNVVTADIQIPDYDVEAGIRVGVVDGNTKGKGTHSISLDFVNKNIPQLSVVGRANLKAMKEGMMQLQILVPFLNTDATFTANMKREDELEMELKSDIKVMAAVSEQKFKVKYDALKMEVEFKSDVNTETGSMPYYDMVENYGNEVLDMRVGNTDMKVRHIFKKFVEAANNYMETYGADIPYIQNFRVPAMPEISLPETLFLNTEAKAVYYFNDQRFTVLVPVPYIGGKSFRQMNLPEVLTTPHVSLPSIGLEMVSMEVPIPDLVMPDSFTMSFPLFGKAELSTLMKSNLYNMEASMAAGKEETGRYSAKFDVKGISPMDILSMNMEGSGVLDVTESMKAVMKSSFVHKFFEAHVNIAEDATVTDKLNLKSNGKIEASSPIGFNLVLEHIGTTGINYEEISAESTFNGMVTAGPLYGKTISTQSFVVIPLRPEVKFDSSVQVDSTIFQARNTIATSLTTDALSFVSTTNAFDDHLTHVVDFSIRNSRLALKCDSNAFALGMKIRNQVDASAGAGAVMMRMETNSEQSENRVYSLFTAVFDASGLVVTSDAMMKLIENEATHKATLKFNQDGLTTSGTTTVQSPLALENSFSAGIDTSGATLSVTNKAATNGMKFDNSNNMLITLSTFNFDSNVEAVAGSVASYTHNITVAMKPYTATANIINNLNVLMAEVVNEAKLQVEPYKMDLTGTLKAMVGDEEFKHTYQVNYADMIANAKCSTTGKLFGTHMSHNSEVEIFGLAARITSDARFNSQPVRFDHTIRCSIVPFDFNLDAIFNADGDLIFFGKHSGQLYGKWLLRAQPLAFTSTQECRASLTQQLNDGYSIETIFDNKMDNVLSPQEQKSNLRMRFKVNDFDFNQAFSAYNTEERAGVELSSSFFTRLFDVDTRERQEFTLSGFVKYDKNTDSRIIQFPFMENLPVMVESLKNIIVSFAETLQNFIDDKDVRAKLEAFPEYVSDFMSQVNIENYLTQAKLFFTDITNFGPVFDISMEDIEASLEGFNIFMKKMLKNLSDLIVTFGQTVNNVIFSGTQPLIDQLIDLNEALNIKATILYVIDAIRDGIQATDFNKLEGTRFAFLKDFDISYIKRELDVTMKDLKRIVESFDLEVFVDDLKNVCISIYESIVDIFIYRMPTHHLGEMKQFIIKTIQEQNILETLSATSAKMTELIGKFEVDKKIAYILENVMALMRQFRIEETIRTVATMAKNCELQLMQIFQRAFEYLTIRDMKDVIEDVNVSLDSVINTLKAMDYNEFVDYANQIIASYTVYVNDLIRTFEIPQKLEATREFVNFVLSSVQNVIEHIREIRVRDIFATLKDMNEQLIRPNLHRFVEFVKQGILDFDIRPKIQDYLYFVSSIHRLVNHMIVDVLNNIIYYSEMVLPNQQITIEMRQMKAVFEAQFKMPELIIPSFTIPFTDLVVPSSRTSMRNVRIPAQLDIPEFTIMGVHTVRATTISASEIKQKIIQYIDLFVNAEIQMFDPEVFFGELTMSFLPPMPDITLPDLTFPEISIPTIPQIPVEKLVESLQIPDFKLPSVPTEVMVPCFGKLYGEIKLLTPIYTVKTSAEFQNSTESEMTPTFTAFLTSQGTSQNFEILNYKLESMSRIAVPKMSRVVFSETLKFTHEALGVEHQASVSLYGLSAQGQAKTGVKVMTSFYTANFMNIAFIAIEEGMSASLETTYTHLMNFPVRDIRHELTLTQKAVVRQDGLTVSLSADNSANGNFNGQNGNHKSNIQLSLTPRMSTIAFTGDTDFVLLKMKQQMNGELQIPVYVKFNVRNEAETPFIKNSLFLARGHANLYDMQAELKVNHDTELFGVVSGTVSNGLNLLVRPFEFVFEFQNKGNNKVVLTEILVAKIDLQNDYSAILRPGSQQLNTVALARVNQHRMFYNFTVDNNPTEVGFIVSMESESDLGFLNTPITIPELDLPFVDFRSPAISNVNLYEQIGLMNILTTTEQTVNMDAKVIYQKNQGDRFVDVMGMMQVPLMGNVISELAFKSAIINLNINAGLFAEENLVMRLRATTASVFESLRTKLDGTTSLSTKAGIKLANSMSLENIHIGGTHDSTISVILETLEATISVATVAKVALPVLTLEANQNLLADTKTKANAVSTFNFKGNLNIPLINTMGKANGDYTLKMEGTFDDVSMESSFRTALDGSVFEDYSVLGFLDNDLNFYINNNGLRSTGKFIADGKLNNGVTKILSMEVNENSAVEVSLSRVYALLKYSGMNEANIFNFNTAGKQVATATVDLSMTSPMTIDIDIDLSQPTSMGDFNVYVKNNAGVTAAEQKMSTILKFVSPVYTTNMAAEVEGKAPVYKVTMKPSANSAFPVLNYDMDASSIANFENGALDMNNKVILTHSEFNMDASHMLTHALRSKRQADNSYHTLNVDVTSPTFADMNFRYAARRDGVSASLSAPVAGFMGLQFNTRLPYQMRVYGRYPSAPEVDIDMLVIRTILKDDDKMKVQISYNMEVPKAVLAELQTKRALILSKFSMLADKYQITRSVEALKTVVVNRINEAYQAVINYDASMSQLSIFFRNIIVQSQKTIQVFLDAFIRVLRETQFRLPGSDEMTTLPVVLHRLTSVTAAVVENTIQKISENTEVYYNTMVEKFSSVQLSMPISDVVSINQFFDQVKMFVKTVVNEVVDFVKNMESLDTMLLKIGETLEAVVEKSQDFVDIVRSDYIDAVFVHFNVLYSDFITMAKNAADMIMNMNMEDISNTFAYIIGRFIFVVEQFNEVVYGFLGQVSDVVQASIRVENGMLEIDLPLTFQQ